MSNILGDLDNELDGDMADEIVGPSIEIEGAEESKRAQRTRFSLAEKM